MSLFPNKPHEEMIQVSKKSLDCHAKAVKAITKKEKSVFDDRYGYLNYMLERQQTLKIKVADIKNLTIDDIYKILDKEIKGHKNYRYYLALWLYANEKGIRHFTDVSANQIIQMATGKTSKQIRQRDRIDFTESLLSWNNERYITQTDRKYVGKKNGKNIYEETDTVKYIKLFDIDELTLSQVVDEDGKVIKNKTLKKFSGRFSELLVNERIKGAYIPKSVLKLTGNESARFFLSLSIWQTANCRHNALESLETALKSFSIKKIDWDRARWIKEASLSVTDNENPAKANSDLLNTFKRLKELNIIADYPHVISVNNDSIISISLPDLTLTKSN